MRAFDGLSVYSRMAGQGRQDDGVLPTTRPAFAGESHRHLYLQFAFSQLIQSGAGIFDAETYISTQQTQAL